MYYKFLESVEDKDVTYREFPDGLRLIYRDGEYEGFYHPEASEEYVKELEYEMGRYKKKVADDAKRIEALEGTVAATNETFGGFVAAVLKVWSCDSEDKAIELPMENVNNAVNGMELKIDFDQEKRAYRMYCKEK